MLENLEIDSTSFIPGQLYVIFHDIFSLLCCLKANLSLIEHGLWITIIFFAGMAWKAKTKGNPGREIEISSLEG